ncbi:Uncharacterized protein YR821_0949 [Yersinia ruckeri]|uniref:Uncharacterized protein n=1 Tax=Yersinia ruckeri TaxID=29486 RepID=A0A0A8VAN6_YERRU|nr:hypothetical protein yruck0001_22550 [Yersinia ruckeri ATCC 29473]QTD75880.1 Uncharacterized protein YR821_0949 [Yersinia ruckeri]CEK26777.1 hypothetical protein CSF007_5045 [Yersinia ruckeri]
MIFYFSFSFSFSFSFFLFLDAVIIKGGILLLLCIYLIYSD